MARQIIAKKTITFYEGDESLLQAIETAANEDKRNLTSYIMMVLEEKLSGRIEKTEEENSYVVPKDSFESLFGKNT